MSENTITTIVWGVVAVAGIQAWTVYALVHLFVTGRALFTVRKPDEAQRTRSRLEES